MIDPDNLQPADEPLHKVLPAGKPIASAWWACPVCALTTTGQAPKSCMCMREEPGCPVEGGQA